MGYRLQAMSFLVGTPESTAAAMSFCVHCLAAHPAAQAVLLRARRPTPVMHLNDGTVQWCRGAWT